MRSFRLHVPPFFMALWLAGAVIGAMVYGLWLGAAEAATPHANSDTPAKPDIAPRG